MSIDNLVRRLVGWRWVVGGERKTVRWTMGPAPNQQPRFAGDPAMSRHLPVAEPDREEGVVVSRPRVGRQAPGFLRDRTAETEKGGSLCHCGAQLRLQGLKPSLRSTGCIEKQLPSGNVRHVDDPPSPRLLGRPRRPSRQDQIANPLDRLQVRVKNAPSTTGESHA